MSAKKQGVTRSKRSGSGAARAKQSPPIFRVMVKDALESWVVPTLALAIAGLFWLLSAIDVWSEAVAVVGVAAALLVLALFAALRPHLFAQDARHRRAAVGFAPALGVLLVPRFF